jgi:hypothetical protein
MLLLDLVGEDRVSHNLDFRHDAAELEATAPHVIPGGNQAETAKIVASDPMCRFLRIAESILRLMPEHDAAKRPIWGVPGNPQHVAESNPLINSGDKEHAAFSFTQQFEAAFQP